MPLFPIEFSINDSKIVSQVPRKTKLLADLIPGNHKTYIYKEEKPYYEEYKKSWFGITHKKSGWDCMRHYEILACGCIPLFNDIESCPVNTMVFVHEDIIIKTNELYLEMKKCLSDIDIIDPCLENKAIEYIQILLDHTRKYLTNKKISEYILDKINFKKTDKKILYLSKDINADYLRCEVLVGFKELLGINCHDYPKIDHIYKECPDSKVKIQWGYGISYTKLINNDKHDYKLDNTIEEDIKNHIYDLVIYGSYHRGMILWEIVNSAYKPDEIVLLCGEDIHNCNYQDYVNSGYNVFVREL